MGSGLEDSIATSLAAATIEHFTAQIEAVDTAIRATIDQDDELRGRRNLLLNCAVGFPASSTTRMRGPASGPSPRGRRCPYRR